MAAEMRLHDVGTHVGQYQNPQKKDGDSHPNQTSAGLWLALDPEPCFFHEYIRLFHQLGRLKEMNPEYTTSQTPQHHVPASRR